MLPKTMVCDATTTDGAPDWYACSIVAFTSALYARKLPSCRRDHIGESALVPPPRTTRTTAARLASRKAEIAAVAPAGRRLRVHTHMLSERTT